MRDARADRRRDRSMPYHRCPECALTVQSTAGHFAAKSCPRCSVPLERTDEIQRPERGSAEIGGRSVAAAGGPFRREALAPYAQPRLARSLLEVATSVVPYLGLCWLIGWERFLLVWAPSALLAGSVGIWLFYVQHQFEDAYWQNAAGWNYDDAALRGSSYLKLPRLLQFFTGNIGLHHVHHLNARIPNYNLQAAHDHNPILHGVPTLSLWDGLRAVTLKLWDEDSGKLLTFGQARAAYARSALAPGEPRFSNTSL